MEKKDIRMNFLINPDLRQRLKHQSVRENRPMSKIISELIEQYLENQNKGE